jgi:hypothetical protein
VEHYLYKLQQIVLIVEQEEAYSRLLGNYFYNSLSSVSAYEDHQDTDFLIRTFKSATESIYLVIGNFFSIMPQE